MSDASDEELIPPVESEQAKGNGIRGRLSPLINQRGPVIVAIAASAGFLILLCLVIILLLDSGDGEEPTPTPVDVVEVEDVDTDTFVYEAINETGVVSVTVETPIFVSVGGDEFSVQAEVIPDTGPWIPVAPNETTALWVYGSIINYVFGLDDTSENRTLLEELNMGDEIVLTTRNGTKSTFAVSSRTEVDSSDREIYNQRAPLVTIVIIEEDPEDTRLVVQGRYVLDDGQAGESPGRVVEIGETAQLEGLQISVTSVSHQTDRPEAPPGFAFFTIDYQIQNVGQVSVNSSSLNMVLADDLGNLYALNPIASRLGNNPPLSGSIAAGQSLAATAGYQIPQGLLSPTLRWQVSMAGTGSQIQVNILFQNSQAPVQDVTITLDEAVVSGDGGSLVLSGSVTNLSDRPLTVDVPDVSLVSSVGTVFLMLSTNPGFPWTIPPGQTLLYGVTFQRPVGGDAQFTILNQSFQLTIIG